MPMSPEQAQQWLEKNPDDPRAEKVRAKLAELRTHQSGGPVAQPEGTPVNPGPRRYGQAGPLEGHAGRHLVGLAARLGLPIAAGLATGGAGFLPALAATTAGGIGGGMIDRGLNGGDVLNPKDIGMDAALNAGPMLALKGVGSALGYGLRKTADSANMMNPSLLRSLLVRAGARMGGLTPAERLVGLGKTGALRGMTDAPLSEVGALAKSEGGFVPAAQRVAGKLGTKARLAEEMGGLAGQDPLAGLDDAAKARLLELSRGGEAAPEAARALADRYKVMGDRGLSALEAQPPAVDDATFETMREAGVPHSVAAKALARDAGEKAALARDASGAVAAVPAAPAGVEATPVGIAAARAKNAMLARHAGDADLAARAEQNLPGLREDVGKAEAANFKASKGLKEAINQNTGPNPDAIKAARGPELAALLDRSPVDKQAIYENAKGNFLSTDSPPIRDAANKALDAFAQSGALTDTYKRGLAAQAQAKGLFGKVPSTSDVANDAALAEQIKAWAPAAEAAGTAQRVASAAGVPPGASPLPFSIREAMLSDASVRSAAAEAAGRRAAAVGAAPEDFTNYAMQENILRRGADLGEKYRSLSGEAQGLGGVDPAQADKYATSGGALENWVEGLKKGGIKAKGEEIGAAARIGGALAGAGPRHAFNNIFPFESYAPRLGPKQLLQGATQGEAELAYRGLPAVNDALRATLTRPNYPAVLGQAAAQVPGAYGALRDWLTGRQ